MPVERPRDPPTPGEMSMPMEPSITSMERTGTAAGLFIDGLFGNADDDDDDDDSKADDEDEVVGLVEEDDVIG